MYATSLQAWPLLYNMFFFLHKRSGVIKDRELGLEPLKVEVE